MRAQPARLISVAFCASLAGCIGARTGSSATPQSRPSVGVMARPCGLAKTISGTLRNTMLERHWRELEQDTEQPLRQIVSSRATVQSALESLDERVLDRHDWSLTRYLVRLLRELEAPDLRAAQSLLQMDAYAQSALQDAAWDTANGWDVVSRVRGESIQILMWIDDVRAGRIKVSGESASAELPKLAQDVTDRLLQAAKDLERYSMASECREPSDPIAK
jgi:hypothetical protein